MNRILAIVLAISCALGAYYFSLHKGFVNPYPVVCDLVFEKIFLEPEQIQKWKRTCHRRSRLVTPYSQKNLVIKDINNVLGLLNVSHLEVFDSAEVQTIWKGESQETGIESEFVESELVVFKVHSKSPAALAGLQMGDVIKTINDEQPNPWEAQSQSGIFVIDRAGQNFTFKISTSAISRDEEMTLKKMSPTVAILKAPSFRASYFSDEKLQAMQGDLVGVRKLVVDLRGNVGGNFVAGLRFLSLLMCSSEEVGKISRPRWAESSTIEMPNDLDDDHQLAVFNKHQEVLLKTFPLAKCFQGELRGVLVDGKTASVAEMVAQALKEFRQARLLGAPSRGQLLVGVWYPLNEIGPGVEISIPEAVYLSRQGHRIEGHGVNLDRVLYYNISEMQSGIDSWVKKTLD